MRQIKVAICDDDKMIGDSVGMISAQIFEKYEIKIETTIYSDPVKLYQDFKNNAQYNLFFLDIEMPRLDGIDLTLKLKEIKEDIDVIFVSNREDKVFETFKAHPFGFVRKSNFKEDFENCVKGYVSTKSQDEHYIAIETYNKSKTVNVKISDVVYIECQRDHQYIHTINNEVIDVRLTMESLEKKLAEYDIVRVHKGYMVNFKYVSCIDSNGVLLKTGFLAFISRNKVQEIKANYLHYLRKTGAVLFN